MPVAAPEIVLEQLGRLPGGKELLELATGREDMELVGGAVRDLLLGRTPRELDVVVAGASAELAAALAESLPESERPFGEPLIPTLHERFGTASLAWISGRIDTAELRVESYVAPGALPEVRPGSVEEDLARRDFTVNAIGLLLGGEHRGELIAVEHALEDLDAGQLRALHERSFLDDPTRLLRLARYSARLGFEIEPHTLELARAALASGALRTVSGGRIASELWLFTEEGDTGGFATLGELGVLEALGLPARFDTELHRRALDLMPEDGVHDILDMAVLFHPPADDGPVAAEVAVPIMEKFEFFAETRERVLASAFGVHALAAALVEATRPSEIRGLLAGRPVEAVVMAGALVEPSSPEAAERAVRWLDELRHVNLAITGSDLLTAGIPEGPEIGRRLEAVLKLRLDGELAGDREAELKVALDLATPEEMARAGRRERG
jgi:tRNA nucleotidyltransferase (CCA-adding enzyme)